MPIPAGPSQQPGLKLTAVAIVAQAVWGMARNLCPDRERASIAVVAALIILFSTASIAQIGAIVLGGLAGLWLCRSEAPAPSGHVEIPVSRTVGLITLGLFFVLLAGLPALRGLTGSTDVGALPFWDSLRRRAGAQAMMRGVNAAVVGVLGAALYNPVWTTSVKSGGDFGIALVGFVLLTAWRAPPLIVVTISAPGGIMLAVAGS